LALNWADPALGADASSSAVGAVARSSSADTLRLSLGACEARALGDGEEARIAETRLRTARARYLVARASVLPHLEWTSSYTQQLESIYQGTTGGDAFSADTTKSIEERLREVEKALPNAGFYSIGQLFSNSSFASKHAYLGTLSASQKLFQGGFLWHSIAGARHALRGAESARDDGIADVVLGVRQAYLDALWADREVEIAALALAQAESQLHRVTLRAEAGGTSEFERMRAEVNRDNQRPTLQWAKNEREQRYLDLRRLVNLPAESPLRLSSPLLDPERLPIESMSVDTSGWVASSFEAPALRGLEQDAEAERHRVAIAGAARWPELSLFASLSQQAYPGDLSPKASEWRRDARAGVSLHWTLFDGLETKGTIQLAKVERDYAEIEYTRAREATRQAVLGGRGELLRALEDLRARSGTVAVARRAYELARLRYDEGASSLIEVEETRRDLELAERNEARSRRDFLVALARLERVTSRPLFRGLVAGGQ